MLYTLIITVYMLYYNYYSTCYTLIITVLLYYNYYSTSYTIIITVHVVL